MNDEDSIEQAEFLASTELTEEHMDEKQKSDYAEDNSVFNNNNNNNNNTTATTSTISDIKVPVASPATLQMEMDIVSNTGKTSTDYIFDKGSFYTATQKYFYAAGKGQKYTTSLEDIISPQEIDMNFENNDNCEQNQEQSQSNQIEMTPIVNNKTYPLIIVIRGLASNGNSSSMLPETKSNTSQFTTDRDIYQINIVNFPKSSESEQRTPVLLKQLLLASDSVYELQEIYGHSLDDPTAAECVVCWSEFKEIMLLPCRHFCVCNACFSKLDRCPVCRSPCLSYIRFKNIKTLE